VLFADRCLGSATADGKDEKYQPELHASPLKNSCHTSPARDSRFQVSPFHDPRLVEHAQPFSA
jgi:hypothetical protein